MDKNKIIEFFREEVSKRNLSEELVIDRINRMETSKNIVLVNYGNACWSIEDTDLNEVIIDEDVLNIIVEEQASKEAI